MKELQHGTMYNCIQYYYNFQFRDKFNRCSIESILIRHMYIATQKILVNISLIKSLPRQHLRNRTRNEPCDYPRDHARDHCHGHASDHVHTSTWCRATCTTVSTNHSVNNISLFRKVKVYIVHYFINRKWLCKCRWTTDMWILCSIRKPVACIFLVNNMVRK